MQKIGVRGVWTFRERDKNGIIVAERVFHNLFTNYGLTNLATGGAFPQYLVIENNYTTLNAALTGGVSTTAVVPARIDQAGDTQIVLSPGLASQEVVTFSSVTGTGPYTYNLSSACTNNHLLNDPVCRQPNQNDTMSNVVGEQPYDSVNYPNMRVQNSGGYSAGNGNWTTQFYFPGGSANVYFMMCGLADSMTIGQGNLHNHFVLGYNHVSTANDLEVDGSITLTNV